MGIFDSTQTVDFVSYEILFMIQMHHDDDLLVLLGTMVKVNSSFGILLIACELCQQTNQAFDECSDMVKQFDWYLFPVEIQRTMPMILYFTQQPIELICFGSWPCNRETFKYVSEIEKNRNKFYVCNNCIIFFRCSIRLSHFFGLNA